MKIVCDTSAYSEFKRGDERIVDMIARASAIFIPSIVLGELKAGFKGGRRERTNIHELDQFLSSPRVNVAIVSEDTADFYARIYHQLKKAGSPIPANDLWIAAITFECGAMLLSTDAHFQAVPGLVILPE
ncbi:MAG: type II toxin-antitoxin system VapC family toxin [Spirochaetota bacterium]